MPDITFTVSTGFLTRARAVVRFEQPNLINATDTVVNAAARERAKTMIIDWINRIELLMAAQNAQAGIAPPGTGDID